MNLRSAYMSASIKYFNYAIYFFDHVKEARESHDLVIFCSLRIRRRSYALHTYYFMPNMILSHRTQIQPCTQIVKATRFLRTHRYRVLTTKCRNPSLPVSTSTHILPDPTSTLPTKPHNSSLLYETVTPKSLSRLLNPYQLTSRQNCLLKRQISDPHK